MTNLRQEKNDLICRIISKLICFTYYKQKYQELLIFHAVNMQTNLLGRTISEQCLINLGFIDCRHYLFQLA